MTTKTQLQKKVQELETELQEFRSQLSYYKEFPTLKEANVEDRLEDGSIVFQKSEGVALLVAPSSTEVECPWSETFPEVSQALKKQGFNPSQWFIPTREQLRLAYYAIPHEFFITSYWSSEEFSATGAYYFDFNTGSPYNCCNKGVRQCVRAFRCVTY